MKNRPPGPVCDIEPSGRFPRLQIPNATALGNHAQDVSNQRPSLVSGQIHASLHLARKRLVIQLATFCYSPNFGKPKYLGIEGARAVILFENLLFQFEQFRTVLGRRRHGRYREGTGADGTGGRVEILIRRGSVRQKMQ